MKHKVKITTFVIAIALTWSLPGADKSWKGGSCPPSDIERCFLWSEPGNWDPPGIPQNGDNLFFALTSIPGQGSAVWTFNDITNLTVASMHFSALSDFQTTSFLLLGDQTLGITRSIDLAGSTYEEVDIHFGLRLEGNAAFRVNWTASGSGLYVKGPVDLNNHILTLAADRHHLVNVSGAISGGGSLLVALSDLQPGTIKLSGSAANTFSGAVMIDDGPGALGRIYAPTLILDKESGPAVPGAFVIGTNAEVKLDRPHQIADTSAVTVFPGGQLKLQGNAETIAELSIIGANAGTSPQETLVDTGSATLTVTGNITARSSGTNPTPAIKGVLALPSAAHIVQTTGSNVSALIIEAAIIGEGGFTKTGSSGLTLGGNNSFTGDAVVQDGRLDVNHNKALGSSSGVTILDGGELVLNGAAVGQETLLANRSTSRVPLLGAVINAAGSASSWAGPILLNTNLSVAGGDITFSGAITGSGGVRFLFSDRVRLTGAEANTYSGDTYCDVKLLELNKPSGTIAFGGRLIVNSGSGAPAEVRWLQDYQRVGAEVVLYSQALINLNNHRDDFGPVTFHGGRISTGDAGELGLYDLVTVNSSSTEAIIDGRIGLPSGNHEFRVSDGAPLADLMVNAVVVGLGGLRKTGPGQMWLNGSNSYGGVTFIEGARS